MLCKLILTTEKTLLIEPGSILREPLMVYLQQYPSEAIDYFMPYIDELDPSTAEGISAFIKMTDNAKSIAKEKALQEAWETGILYKEERSDKIENKKYYGLKGR